MLCRKTSHIDLHGTVSKLRDTEHMLARMLGVSLRQSYLYIKLIASGYRDFLCGEVAC
jgi:hypothetical protein